MVYTMTLQRPCPFGWVLLRSSIITGLVSFLGLQLFSVGVEGQVQLSCDKLQYSLASLWSADYKLVLWPPTYQSQLWGNDQYWRAPEYASACATCSPWIYNCTKASTGSYLVTFNRRNGVASTIAWPCPEHCTRCGNNKGCLQADKGYFRWNSSAIVFPPTLMLIKQCATGCQQCQDWTGCTKAAPGYYLKSNGIGEVRAWPCPTNCSSCQDNKGCVSCKTGYVLDPTATALPAEVGVSWNDRGVASSLPGCRPVKDLRCAQAGAEGCTLCKTGDFKVTSILKGYRSFNVTGLTSCVACPSVCNSTCVDYKGCSNCKGGYRSVTESVSMPRIGFEAMTRATPLLIGVSYNTCAIGNNCTIIQNQAAGWWNSDPWGEFYDLARTIAYAELTSPNWYADSCLECSSSGYDRYVGGNCTKAAPGSYLVSFPVIWENYDNEDNSYYVGFNNTIAWRCPQHCTRCDKDKGCVKADKGYFRWRNELYGASFPPTLMLLKQCAKGCQRCQDFKGCTKAAPGYYLKADGAKEVRAWACPTGCKRCQDNKGCVSCKPGYVLDGIATALIHGDGSGLISPDFLPGCRSVKDLRCAKVGVGCASCNKGDYKLTSVVRANTGGLGSSELDLTLEGLTSCVACPASCSSACVDHEGCTKCKAGYAEKTIRINPNLNNPKDKNLAQAPPTPLLMGTSYGICVKK